MNSKILQMNSTSKKEREEAEELNVTCRGQSKYTESPSKRVFEIVSRANEIVLKGTR